MINATYPVQSLLYAYRLPGIVLFLFLFVEYFILWYMMFLTWWSPIPLLVLVLTLVFFLLSIYVSWLLIATKCCYLDSVFLLSIYLTNQFLLSRICVSATYQSIFFLETNVFVCHTLNNRFVIIYACLRSIFCHQVFRMIDCVSRACVHVQNKLLQHKCGYGVILEIIKCWFLLVYHEVKFPSYT